MLTLSAVGIASPATAGPGFDRRLAGIESRQAAQAGRIDQGVVSGRIGAREQSLIARQQSSIDASIDRRAADGRLGARDLRAIGTRLDRGAAGVRFARARGPQG